ncbi:MAG: sugar phosphate nucleotidyltransferase [Methanosarcinaceae archaeon]
MKTIILAAGSGTRLMPLSENSAKTAILISSLLLIIKISWMELWSLQIMA